MARPVPLPSHSGAYVKTAKVERVAEMREFDSAPEFPERRVQRHHIGVFRYDWLCGRSCYIDRVEGGRTGMCSWSQGHVTGALCTMDCCWVDEQEARKMQLCMDVK